MEEIETLKHGIARVDTDFIRYNINQLSEREKRFVLYFISKISDSNTVFIELQKLLKEKQNFGITWDKSLKELNEFMLNLSKQTITFKTNVIVKGVALNGYINWFQSIIPIEKKGIQGYEITFSDKILPFVLNLKKYVRINSQHIANLSGRHTIELYNKFLSIYEPQKKYKNLVILKISLEDLKTLLNVNDQYKQYKDFKKRILTDSLNKINDYTPIYVWYKQYGKPVHTLEFYIVENYYNSNHKEKPTKKELAELNQYQYNAYNIMVNYGIFPGIAFHRILPILPKGELQNFPDYFIKFSIDNFNNKTKLLKKHRAGAFVNWFYHKKIYDINDNSGVAIREKIINAIKQHPELMKRINEKPKKLKEIYGEELELFK